MSADWMGRAACRNLSKSNLPFARGGAAAKFAKEYCRPCPVRAECLEYGLSYDDPGTYGGLGQQKRRALKNPRPVKPCGTPAAYARHRANGEDACEPCKAARRVAGRRRYQKRKAAA